MPNLKPYVISDGEPYEYAILVFHFTVKQAKVMGWDYWEADTDFIDMRANLMKEDHIFSEAKQDLLEQNIPHCIPLPTMCEVCEHWGYPMKNGFCEDCIESANCDYDDCIE